MKPKAIVLLSGGLDSCVTLAHALDKGYDPYILNVYYGQRHSKEREAAWEIRRFYSIPDERCKSIDLIGFASMVQGATLLTDPKSTLPDREEKEMGHGKAPTYVPGRNTIMLALGQSFAESVGAEVVFTGVNAVDYSGYADCRPEFIAAWNDLAAVATFSGVDGKPIFVDAPLINLTKVEIVQKGLDLKAPLHLSWSCYAGGKTPCGLCDSCKIRNAAFSTLGMVDPSLVGGE